MTTRSNEIERTERAIRTDGNPTAVPWGEHWHCESCGIHVSRAGLGAHEQRYHAGAQTCWSWRAPLVGEAYHCERCPAMTMTRDDYRWSEAIADLFARQGDDDSGDRDEDEGEEA